MRRYVLLMDQINLRVGHAFAWLIVVLALGICYEVFVRYVLRDPTAWAFDMSWILYGALIIMGGAYTLSRDGHVRADIFYRLWPPRVQAGLELMLYGLFFFPGVLALAFAGYGYAMDSWRYLEVSVNSPAGIPIYLVKSLIPLGGILLLFQGIAEVCCCIICLKSGSWPRRAADVEEFETVLQHQQDIQPLGPGPAQ